MFWRFGFQGTSTLDALLDKPDVPLESILDDEDLLQECKAQNTRLIDLFRREDVVQRLLSFVSGNIVGEGVGQYKYPYIATEVMCSDIWSIIETCLNCHDMYLLRDFWNDMLNREQEDIRKRNVMASHFAKINATFLLRKPAEMLAFIQAQPSVVERILKHIETPALVDLLFRIMQLDECSAGLGVLDWLSRERLVPRLIELLSASSPPSTHAVVSELLKGIISASEPSPGAGITDNFQNGPASNIFARHLAKRENIERLVGFMLDDFEFEMELKQASSQSLNTSGMEVGTSGSSALSLPNSDSAISSGTHAISIIIELIRKNNSDYFEPYLFHTIRNRLIQVQQHLHVQSDEGRETLETAFNELVDRMGVVHLGPLLEIMCDRLERFQQLLHKPRSSKEPIPTTIGHLIPLTFERFRICELYAELLHCSNMSLLNRPPEFDNLYDDEGRLRGGLSALEDLARVIAIGSGNDDQSDMDAEFQDIEPAQELPVSMGLADMNGHPSDDEDMSPSGSHSSNDDDVMEEIDMADDLHTASPPPISPQEDDIAENPPLIIPLSPVDAPHSDSMPLNVRRRRSSSSRTGSDRSSLRSRQGSVGSRSFKRSILGEREGSEFLPVGDKLKQRFSETRVLSTLLDLFFGFPWNNFLHSVVYDVLHQILTGRTDNGLNRELTIALFRDGQLLSRIVEAQKRNDAESLKPKHVRLGYMGHLTLISEDVIMALNHFPPDLKLQLARYAPQPDWDDYVSGRYHETKTKDSSLLGGGKPVMTASRGASTWKVDEAEIGASPVPAASNGVQTLSESISSEFPKDSMRSNLAREPSTDFGIPPVTQDDVETASSGPPQFASYLAQAMSTHMNSDEGSDEDDDEGGWLAQKFDNPPVSARSRSEGRRPLDPEGFADPFGMPTNASSSIPSAGFEDSFTFDNDDFGPFSDAAAAVSPEGDPFSSSTILEDAEDASFENFNDFGDFQSGSGDLTPTGGSWTFASDASHSSGSEDADVLEGLSESNPPRDHRTDITK